MQCVYIIIHVLYIPICNAVCVHYNTCTILYLYVMQCVYIIYCTIPICNAVCVHYILYYTYM